MERPTSNGSSSPDNHNHNRTLSGNGTGPGPGNINPGSASGSNRTGTDPRDPRSFPSPHQVIVDHPMPMRIPDESNVTELKPPRPPSTSPTSPRKRKKPSDGDSEPVRRLRRNHEACSRCRHKKIKCDSGHPSCSACVAANAICQQEDRHRNRFQPRAHQEMIENQLIHTTMLLKKFIPDFDPARVHFFAAQHGIILPESSPSVPTSTPPGAHSIYSHSPSNSESYSIRSPVDHPSVQPSTPSTPYFRPPPYPNNYQVGQDGRNYRLQEDGIRHPNRENQADNGQKGVDPLGRNMASPAAIARGFGVTSRLLDDPRYIDREPVKVDGDDVPLVTSTESLSPQLWQRRPFKRGNLPLPSHSSSELSDVWLPRDHKTARYMVDMYFKRLNFHRPIFEQGDYNRRFEMLYTNDSTTPDDVGFICSTYLVLALATLSEIHQPTATEAGLAELKQSWPSHEAFLSRALAVKPELRVTISTLQALLLLQWYLYSERHTRSLWRLVGQLVRVAIELGLHHDPKMQQGTFTPEECTLRINLWCSVMIHDRGTSVLLGRPCAIGEDDFNTSWPTLVPGVVSRHFVDSAPLNRIAADIIKSLYRPSVQSTDIIIREARRILISMADFRATLPSDYDPYFLGTRGWTEGHKESLRKELTTEKGLTFLKYTIQRLLLLRAVFTNDEMLIDVRIKALHDALKTSHNVILMHASLIQIPDIGFFVSPLPLHLAATTIIYGQSCGFTTLPYETGYEDVHSALYLTPALRWNWQRKDAAGGVHPITLELANRVFKKKPPVMNQPKTIPDFYPEEDWREDLVMNAQTDATLGHWPSKLFLPGPAWPDRHQISHTRGDSSNRSESASPVGQNAVPRRLSINGTSNGAGTSAGAGGSGAGAGGNGGNTNGNGSGASAGAGPSMPGAGTSYFKQEEIDLTSIFAQVPGYAYGAINVQPESEIQELFMQEEKDPMARANWSSRHGINLQDMGQQLQHMGYTPTNIRQWPSQPGP